MGPRWPPKFLVYDNINYILWKSCFLKRLQLCFRFEHNWKTLPRLPFGLLSLHPWSLSWICRIARFKYKFLTRISWICQIAPMRSELIHKKWPVVKGTNLFGPRRVTDNVISSLTYCVSRKNQQRLTERPGWFKQIRCCSSFKLIPMQDNLSYKNSITIHKTSSQAR